MAWFKRENIPLSEELKEVKAKIRSKISVPGTFDSNNIAVTFYIPKEFIRMHDENFKGEIEWREFHVSRDRKVICAQNNWGKKSEMSTHHHLNADEHLYVINGLLRITIFDKNGGISEMIALTPRSNEYIIPAGVPHFAETLDLDTQFVVKFIDTK